MVKYAKEFKKQGKQLVRNLYGFFVMERVLMRLKDVELYRELEFEIKAQIPLLGDKNLKTKWTNLLSRDYISSPMSSSN